MSVPKQLRPYLAIVWETKPDSAGVRVTVVAEDLADAERKLRNEHGEDIVFTLYNEEDAAKPR